MQTATKFRSIAIILILLGLITPAIDGRTKKGDVLIKVGEDAEARRDWDAALENYEKALAEDPADARYQIATRRLRFQAAQKHVNLGLEFRAAGKLPEALKEFERAYAIDPSSAVAAQEIRNTLQMIERESKKPSSTPEQRGLTEADLARRESAEKIKSIESVPQLRPINRTPLNIRINNQHPRVLFETVAKVAGINTVFDPEYQQQHPIRTASLELNNATLEQALDYIAVLTKSFWKPLSPNAIFITTDNPNKRRDFDEHVVRVFYLSNVTSAQELQEISTAIRAITDIKKLFTYNSQNAIIVRGETDRVALAEKVLADLDKPKPEVVIDVLVMETAKGRTREIGAGLISNGKVGLDLSVTYNGGAAQQPSDSGTGSGSTSSGTIPLSDLLKLSSSDFSVNVPGAFLRALLDDRSVRILQSPQVRALDNQKATLRLGDRQPVASGSFQPGIGGVGINPLVNTQFQYIDVGVNVDITPKVHSKDEISLHVELEISNVRERINLGGIEQPVISQRRVVHDIRIQEGQVNLLGGLMQSQESISVQGIPGLSQIPGLRRLFSSEKIERTEAELLVALVPHIVRGQEIGAENLRTIASGPELTVKLNYLPVGEAAPAAVPVPPVKPAEAQPPAPVTAPVEQPAAPPVATTPETPAPTEAQPPKPPAPGAPATAPAEAQPGQQAPPPPPTGNTRVYLQQTQWRVKAGTTFTMQLRADNVTDIFAVPVKLVFDKEVVELVDATPGEFLAQGGTQVLAPKNIRSDVGEATINLNRLPGSGGASGSGALLNLTFKGLKSGMTVIQFDRIGLYDTTLQPKMNASTSATVTVDQ